MFINKKLQESVSNIESIVDRIDQQMMQNMNKTNLHLEQISTKAPELLKQRMLAVRDPGCWDIDDARDGLEVIVMGAYHGNTQTIIHNDCIVEVIRKRNLENNNDNNIKEKS